MAFDSIHNYYEKLVFHEIQQQVINGQRVDDPGLLADIACLALNKLPSRYFRHDVDMAFYLTSRERDEMEEATRNAVATAAQYLTENRQQQPDTTDELS